MRSSPFAAPWTWSLALWPVENWLRRYYARLSVALAVAIAGNVPGAGRRLAVVVGGTDGAQFIAPSQRPALARDLARTSVSVPVAAGALG